MDRIERLNEALDYIEDNLTRDIDYREVARRACCSEYHFRRMFSFIAGVPLSEYIRRRRLTLAAFELDNSTANIADIAKKYEYRSPDAFTRAFKEWHGLTPSKARNSSQSLKACPRMSFHLSITGGTAMNYRIEEKDTFNIIGISKRVPIIFEGVNPQIEEMWQTLDSKTNTRLKGLSNMQPSGLIQASTNFSEDRMEEQGELDHYIGVATTAECPADFSELVVKPSTWAVFEVEGPFPETLQETWGRIYSEWFPSSNYELAEGPEILWNEDKDTTSPTFKSEIWIPVKESKS